MQNIDPVFILQPVIVIIICTGLLVYWYFKRRFHLMIIIYSLVAYAVAIALKYAVQIPTINIIINNFGAHSIALGIYYGFQTVFFEVGLAFSVAWYLVSHRMIERKDAAAYGSSLAFWENAGLLGILSIINLIAYWIILQTSTPLAQTLYNQLNTNAPGLFVPMLQALTSVAFGTIERISSILIHFAWGYLCFMAAYFHKKRLFLIALPMGFIDFLVPFAQSWGIPVFETVVFTLSAISVLLAWYATRQLRKSTKNETALPKS